MSRIAHIVRSHIPAIAISTLAAMTFLCNVQSANAAGLLIADGGFGGVLEIEEHVAQVTINNGIAVTNVTQVFRNTEKRQVEALYMFPVPKDASVANFSMWINGKDDDWRGRREEACPPDLRELQTNSARSRIIGTSRL